MVIFIEGEKAISGQMFDNCNMIVIIPGNERQETVLQQNIFVRFNSFSFFPFSPSSLFLLFPLLLLLLLWLVLNVIDQEHAAAIVMNNFVQLGVIWDLASILTEKKSLFWRDRKSLRIVRFLSCLLKNCLVFNLFVGKRQRWYRSMQYSLIHILPTPS